MMLKKKLLSKVKFNKINKHDFNDNLNKNKNYDQIDNDIRIIEALVFSCNEPLSHEYLLSMISGNDYDYLFKVFEKIKLDYNNKGINFIYNNNYCLFVTASDLSYLMEFKINESKELSNAAKETLAIIAYHQPSTRAEIEEIRGVSISKGSLDALLELNWIKIAGKKQSPGRPILYKTTDKFLIDFGLDEIKHLPNLDDLKRDGLLDTLDKDFDGNETVNIINNL
ncbi:MAG: SMC-Scp complex subunit ScpB [Alphaproteobacteria bacterium]|jgi:segregation and condensation protein B|tara:strand:+ start:13748 stop:14422 length:675 start_codon:yes stop_codon:yes gene_type:complete